MHIPMIDTLCAKLDIKNYEYVDFEQPRDVDIIPFLKQQKSEAKALNALNRNNKHIINIGNQSFQLLPNGSKGYAYILHMMPMKENRGVRETSEKVERHWKI